MSGEAKETMFLCYCFGKKLENQGSGVDVFFCKKKKRRKEALAQTGPARWVRSQVLACSLSGQRIPADFDALACEARWNGLTESSRVTWMYGHVKG